jgi:hypothetical protein
VVTNNYMPSEEYKLAKAAGVFLQGFELPRDGLRNGWALVEFWTSDRAAIDAFVTHLNGRLEGDLGPKRQAPPEDVVLESSAKPEVLRPRLPRSAVRQTPETGGFDVRGEDMLAFLEGGKWVLDADLTRTGPIYGTWDHEFLYRRSGRQEIARVALDAMSLLIEVYANATDLQNAACIDGKDRSFELRPLDPSIARFITPLGQARRLGRGIER